MLFTNRKLPTRLKKLIPIWLFTFLHFFFDSIIAIRPVYIAFNNVLICAKV